MSTGIEWTDETWNPVTGCTKVSEGCDHCYAERITERFHGKGSFDRIVLHPDRLEAPLHWRKPRMVFVNSMSDLFHDGVPGAFITQVFAVMSETPWHTYQVLTKRPGRMASMLSSETFADEVDRAVALWLANEEPLLEHKAWSWPLPNVWLGTSIENQRWANIRIPKLLETRAAVRFLSCEPLLGPIDLPLALEFFETSYPEALLDWVIVGGESGPGARPMDPAWARSLRDQCQDQFAFFFKQWGEWGPVNFGTEMPSGERVARLGKKRTGRELDGRTWDEMPPVGAEAIA